MSGELADEAEFLSHVAGEGSIAKLKALVEDASMERTLPILRRLNDLCGGKDPELLLSLAVRSWHQGQDEDAFLFIEQARRLRPNDREVLRAALFFHASLGENEEAKDIGRRLLALYPDDEWARDMDEKLRHDERILNLSLPPLKTTWEARLNRNA